MVAPVHKRQLYGVRLSVSLSAGLTIRDADSDQRYRPGAAFATSPDFSRWERPG